MSTERDSQALRIALIVVGLIFIFGVWLLMRVWPSGWQWQPSQPEYEQMIMGVYATLGVFLLLAARAPRKHRSLILFTAWSSLVHAGIMGLQAIQDSAERGHLIGDVPALAIVGIALLVLAPKTQESPARIDDAG
jgi:hydrogenase/urease accessory protein HupE